MSEFTEEELPIIEMQEATVRRLTKGITTARVHITVRELRRIIRAAEHAGTCAAYVHPEAAAAWYKEYLKDGAKYLEDPKLKTQ